MFFKNQPKPTVESLRTTIARKEALGRNTAHEYALLKDLVNAALIADLKADRRRARQKEVSAV